MEFNANYSKNKIEVKAMYPSTAATMHAQASQLTIFLHRLKGRKWGGKKKSKTFEQSESQKQATATRINTSHTSSSPAIGTIKHTSSRSFKL